MNVAAIFVGQTAFIVCKGKSRLFSDKYNYIAVVRICVVPDALLVDFTRA